MLIILLTNATTRTHTDIYFIYVSEYFSQHSIVVKYCTTCKTYYYRVRLIWIICSYFSGKLFLCGENPTNDVRANNFFNYDIQ